MIDIYWWLLVDSAMSCVLKETFFFLIMVATSFLAPRRLDGHVGVADTGTTPATPISHRHASFTVLHSSRNSDLNIAAKSGRFTFSKFHWFNSIEDLKSRLFVMTSSMMATLPQLLRWTWSDPGRSQRRLLDLTTKMLSSSDCKCQHLIIGDIRVISYLIDWLSTEWWAEWASV